MLELARYGQHRVQKPSKMPGTWLLDSLPVDSLEGKELVYNK